MRLELKVLKFVVFFIFFLVLLGPLIILGEGWFAPSDEAWSFFVEIEAKEAFLNTFVFAGGTVFVSLGLGVLSAYFISFYDFKGDRFFNWALILPLAVPAYILGYAYLGLFEPTGVVNNTLKALQLPFKLPSLKNIWCAILFKSFTLYPYIFLMAKIVFASQSKHLLETARLSGTSQLKLFFKVILPISWPWLFGGMSLVLMESLADFGMIELFNVDTLTTVIYSKWVAEKSLPTAERISFFLVFFLIFFLIMKRIVIGGKKSYLSVKEGLSYTEKRKLNIFLSICVQTILGIILLLTFIAPIGLIIHLAYKHFQINNMKNWTDFLPYSINSVVFSSLAAFIVTLTVLFLIASSRINKSFWLNLLKKIATIGYAFPGTLLGIGVFAFLLNIDKFIRYIIQTKIFYDVTYFLGLPSRLNTSNFLTASILGLLLGYLIRFFAVSHEGIANSFARIPPSLDETALLCNKSKIEILKTIYFPLLWPSLLVSFILVFVDVMKELPLTLIMRPYGWDTLPIRVYNFTAEGQWQEAAFPSLILVIVGAIPVFFLIKISDKRHVS